MNLLRKYKNKKGLSSICNRGEEKLKRLSFGLLKLSKGEIFNGDTEDKETALVVLSGIVNVRGDGFEYMKIGERKDVFSGKPSAVYLPPSISYNTSADTDTEIAVCSAPSDMKSKPILIKPEDVIEKKLGVLNWERKAYFIIDERVKSKNFYIGETFLKPGKWAFPPHRHDIDNLPEEVEMDEVYHYRVNPGSGFGVQMVYADDKSIDVSYTVRDGDTVLLSEGYHPAAASPADSLYILWMLAGEKRYFLAKPDDDYKWISKVENLLRN